MVSGVVGRDPLTHVGVQVRIDGVIVPCDAESTDPGILSGLKVTWGRTSRLSQPDVSSCDFTMADPDGGSDYTTWITYNSLVEVSYVLPDGTRSRVFAGRVSDLTLTHDEDGDALLDVTAMGLCTSLSAVQMGDNPWPQQDGNARAAAIQAALPPSSPVWFIGPTNGAQVTYARQDVDNRDAWSIITEFGWSMGQIGWPSSRTVTGGTLQPAVQFSQPKAVWDAVGVDDRRVNRRVPVTKMYTAPAAGTGNPAPVDTVCIDACDVDLEGTAFTANPDDTQQSMRITYGPSDAQGTAYWNLNTSADPTRMFEVTSGVIEASVSTVAGWWFYNMTNWGYDFDAPWAVGAIRLDPDTVTGIDDFHLVMAVVLSEAQRIEYPVLLQAMPTWVPWRLKTSHEVAPHVVGRLQGGVYTFEDGRWVLEMNVTIERAVQGGLAPGITVVVRPGDVVPYRHDDASVGFQADPTTPWAVGATARFQDGNYGWDGTAWVLGGVAPIYVGPGDKPAVPHDDPRVRPSPTTPWAVRTYATFTDGQYQWSGGGWVAMVTITPGTTTTLAHTAPNVLPDPTMSWVQVNAWYATFSDGAYTWNSTTWVPYSVPVTVSPGGVYGYPHTQSGITPSPSSAWAPSGTGAHRPYGYATFTDGDWSWRGSSSQWTGGQMERVAPGAVLTGVTASRWLLLVPGPDRTAWSGEDRITVNGEAYRWNGDGGWDLWTPAWNTVPVGVAWQDVPAGTSWTEWTGSE